MPGYALYFRHLEEFAGFFEFFFVFGAAFGLEGFEFLLVLFEGSSGACFVERDQFECFGAVANGAGRGDGGVDLGMLGGVGVAGAIEMADGYDVAGLGAGVVETPGFFGYGTGEESFHRTDGCEIGHHVGAEFVVFDAIFVGHDGGLRCDAVAECVLAGLFFTVGCVGSCGVLRVGAIGCLLLF